MSRVLRDECMAKNTLAVAITERVESERVYRQGDQIRVREMTQR